MAKNEGENNFWWTLIKAGAAITLIDHMFPTEEHQVTEYEKLSTEKKHKINDLKSVISKYNEKINNLKIELGEAIFKEGIEFENDLLKVLLKELKELNDEVKDREEQIESIKTNKS